MSNETTYTTEKQCQKHYKRFMAELYDNTATRNLKRSGYFKPV